MADLGDFQRSGIAVPLPQTATPEPTPQEAAALRGEATVR